MIRCFAILACLLVGCGRQGVDPAFDSYIQSFEADAKVHGRDLRVDYGVEFGDPSANNCQGNSIGCCDVGFAGWSRKVIINKSWWDSMARVSDGMSSRAAVMYHEFGHCSLGRKHNAAMTTMSGPMGSTLPIPASVMNPTAPDGWKFTHNHEAYLQELFVFE